MRTFLTCMGAMALLVALGCGDSGSTSEDAPAGQGGSGGSAAGAGGSAGASGGAQAGGAQAGSGGAQAGSGGASAGGAGAAGATGAKVRIHLASTTDPFTHDDGLSGQTPLSHKSGLRSYRIFRDAADTVGVPVFDLGKGFVEVNYDGGSDTVVAEVPLASIPEGSYTRAQVVHTHVRYRVKATMHTSGLALPGEFDNLQVMSDDTTLDGVTHKSGHYEYVFTTAGKSFPKNGEGAPVPEKPASGGFSVALVNGQWIYEFPVAITIDHALDHDVDATLRVNMFESFRWEDQEKPAYTKGTFDVEPTSFEPVKRFGANSFEVSFK